MLSRWARTWHGTVLAPFLSVLDRLGVSPNALTICGLAAEIIAGYLFAINETAWAVAALLLGQILDSLDGEMARAHATASPLGGFVDSICDHYGDLAVYLGLLWHFLTINAHTEIILIAVALFGSVFGSHVRSRASMAGVDTKTVGVFTRFERTLVLLIGILARQLTIALWVLAIFNNFSALQRIAYTVRAARHEPQTPVQ